MDETWFNIQFVNYIRKFCFYFCAHSLATFKHMIALFQNYPWTMHYYFSISNLFTVNSLINGHPNQRAPLINGQIHFPRRIASQTLIVDSLKSRQAIRGSSFQRTHFRSRNEDFALYSSLISGQGKKITNIVF